VKKRLSLVLAAAAAMGSLSVVAAHADALINTPLGNANVDPSSGLTLDGNSSNPDPLDGYVIVHPDGTVSCADEGGPYNDNGTDNAEFVDPGTCNPQPPVG